jgi:hypothetical protein
LLLKLAVYGIKEKHIMQASGRRNPYTVSIQYSADTILRTDNDFHDLPQPAVDKYTGPLQPAVDKYTARIIHYERFYWRIRQPLRKLYETLMNKFIHSIQKKKSNKEKSDKQKSEQEKSDKKKSDKEGSDEERPDEEGSDEERSDEETSQLCYDLAGNKHLFRIFFLQILVRCLQEHSDLTDFDLRNIGTYLIPELSDFSVYVGAHQRTTSDEKTKTTDDVYFIQFKIPLKCKKEWMDFFVGTTLANPQVIQVESRINNNDPFKHLGCWDPEALKWTKTLDVIDKVFGPKQGGETDKDSYFPTHMGKYKKLHIELQQSNAKNIDEYWFSALKDVFGMYSHGFQEIQGNHDFHTHSHAISQFVRAFAQNALKLSLPTSNAQVKYDVPDPSPNQETQHATQMRVKIGQPQEMALTDWHLSFVVNGSNITITYEGLEIPYIAPKKKWQRTDSWRSVVFFMNAIFKRLESETHHSLDDFLSFFLYFQVRGKNTTLDKKIETVKLRTEDAKSPSPLSVLLFENTVKDLLTTDPAFIQELKVQWIHLLKELDKNCVVDFAKIPTQFIDQGINDVVQFFTEGLGPHSGTIIDVDRWFEKWGVYETMRERLRETLKRLKKDDSTESSEVDSVSSQLSEGEGEEEGEEEEEGEKGGGRGHDKGGGRGHDVLEDGKQGAEKGGGRGHDVHEGGNTYLEFIRAVGNDLARDADEPQQEVAPNNEGARSLEGQIEGDAARSREGPIEGDAARSREGPIQGQMGQRARKQRRKQRP